MTDNKNLIEAVNLVKEHCSNVASCIDAECPLYNKKLERCMFNDMDEWMPQFWDIPKPSRFTDEDIALAKSLRAFGHNTIERCNVGDFTYCRSYDNTCMDYTIISCLPENAFKQLRPCEKIAIDDIIKDGEQ